MVRELGSGLFRLDLRGANAYLIDDDLRILVDAGLPWDGERMRRELAEVGLAPGDVDRIALTHYDLDHVGTLTRLPFDAPITAGEPDAGYVVGRDHPSWRNRKGAFHRLLIAVMASAGLPVEPIEDGERVGPFRAYHTPGHTPGHTVYVDETRDTALLGDLAVVDDGRFRYPSRLLNYDTPQAKASVEEFVTRAPAFETACAGHGSPIRTGGSSALRALAERE